MPPGPWDYRGKHSLPAYVLALLAISTAAVLGVMTRDTVAATIGACARSSWWRWDMLVPKPACESPDYRPSTTHENQTPGKTLKRLTPSIETQDISDRWPGRLTQPPGEEQDVSDSPVIEAPGCFARRLKHILRIETREAK
jgi:hypothetical protein